MACVRRALICENHVGSLTTPGLQVTEPTTPPKQATPPDEKKTGRLRGVLRWALGVVLAFYTLCTLNLVYLRWADPMSTTVQLQRRVESFFERGPYEVRQQFVPLEQIPLELQHAVIAAEDGRFYQHGGIDWLELEIVTDEGLRRGASTLTQQLVKNLFLTTHRSLLRKAVEFTLVLPAEWILSKNRILELYLNVIEWGPGVYGVEAASQYHYGVSAASLDREQAARLAACIPAPRTRRPERMNRYSRVILDRMESRGW